jgi:hypothetical protein
MDSAVLAQHVPTRSRFWIGDAGGSERTYLDHIAYSGRFTIQASAIEIRDSAGVVSDSNVRDGVIFIDNECNGNPAEDTGDLRMLYRYAIADSSSNDRQLVIERDAEDEPFGDLLDSPTAVSHGQPVDGSSTHMDTAAFAVPPDTDELPFYSTTLPCNKFVATKVDGE